MAKLSGGAERKLETGKARQLYLDRLGLLEKPAEIDKGADLLRVIADLGFVQLDSINTEARAHDLILFTRGPAYRLRAQTALRDRPRPVRTLYP